MKSKVVVRGLLLVGALSFTFMAVGAQGSGEQQTEAARKVVQRAPAPYPALALSMALQGVVRLEVVVSPDGSVKDVQIKGGHPVLSQAAINSVRRWRWEAAARESHEIVEVKFMPE